MTYNTAYLQARKSIRVRKLAPGDYLARHSKLRIAAHGKKREVALMKCAFLAARRMTH